MAIFGSKQERDLCNAVAAAIHAPTKNFAGETTLAEFIDMAAACRVYLTNDSGAMHLASALGIPTVGIFGSTNPARTGPFGPRAVVVSHPLDCSPCLARTCRFGHYRCLGEISAAPVADALASRGAFARRSGPVA